jgi:hypothetical protein
MIRNSNITPALRNALNLTSGRALQDTAVSRAWTRGEHTRMQVFFFCFTLGPYAE